MAFLPPRGHRRRAVRHPVVYRSRLRSLADADADAIFRNDDYDDLILLCAAFPSLKCSQTSQVSSGLSPVVLMLGFSSRLPIVNLR